MPTREARAISRRRIIRRRRQVAGGGLVLCCALLAIAGFKLTSALTNEPGSSAIGALSGSAAKPVTPIDSKATASRTSAPVPESTPDTSIRSTGAYKRAPGSTAPRGKGTLKTYRVEVETGTKQSAPAFAAAVDATLADPASWSGQGRWSLQRVDGDAVVDFVIRLAAPATVDKVCASVGLDTRGYVSCRAGSYVMINIDRWLNAVPDYKGDVAMYRNYVVNHEVGHQLGYGHQACPGAGKLAPVMQQQTFGLEGCVKNGWPYVDAKLVTGPATP